MNEKAISAFLSKKADIDIIINRIADESGNHFGVDPDSMGWGDVATIGHIASQLKEISDSIFNEGEYA